MQMIRHHNFPPLIFVMIVGPFYTTPLIIVHGIHIFPHQISLPHSNMNFKGIDNQLGEVMSPVQSETRAVYLNPNFDDR